MHCHHSLIPTALLGFELIHTRVLGFVCLFLAVIVPSTTGDVVLGWCTASHHPDSAYKLKGLHTNSPVALGAQLTLGLRVTGQDLWGMGEGFSMKGSPPLGAACLGVLPAPPFLKGQTVLEGHDFWRQLETVSGFVSLQVSGILLRSQLLWGPLSSPREVPANPTE